MKSKHAKDWRPVQLPASLVKQIEDHIAQPGCTHPNKADFVRDAVRKQLEALSN